MEEVVMTALRRRMIEDMQLAGLSGGTQDRYLTAVAQLAKGYNRSPDQISEEEVRRRAPPVCVPQSATGRPSRRAVTGSVGPPTTGSLPATSRRASFALPNAIHDTPTIAAGSVSLRLGIPPSGRP